MHPTLPVSPLATALVGLAALAAAMGIGRFAFTPLLPLMQQHGEVTLDAGAWLAAANYVGYLCGALACTFLPMRPGTMARIGLAGVAVSTLAMGATASMGAWLALRLLAGVASAFVLVGVSGWTLARLAAARRGQWAGWVYAGVGAGIALAGVVALVAATRGASPADAWIALGAIAGGVALVAWRTFARAGGGATAATPAGRGSFTPATWGLVACYGVFGFGYILPATFLPAAARELVADPSVFGWTWPVFGVAAAVSTVVASLALPRAEPRAVWGASHAVMAFGVALPFVAPGLPALVASALCVGGTFMVATMAGLQEARRLHGVAAPRLMAAMTTAFALGQILGPVAVRFMPAQADPMRAPSLAAAALLALTGAALVLSSRRASATALNL